jgi:hypothetical protein
MVFILTVKLPSTVAIILPISSLIVIPAGTLSGEISVYVKVEPATDNVPEPILFLSTNLIPERSKLEGKLISILFIVAVVLVLKKKL